MKFLTIFLIVLCIITSAQPQKGPPQKGKGQKGPPNGQRPPPPGKGGQRPPPGGKRPPPGKGQKPPPGKRPPQGKRPPSGQQGNMPPPPPGTGPNPKRPPREDEDNEDFDDNIEPWSMKVKERSSDQVLEMNSPQIMHEQVVDIPVDQIRGSFFIIFTNKTCRECQRGATELAKLANVTDDAPTVMRVDCTHEFEFCDIFVSHKNVSNGTYPFMVMATPERTHIWNGPIEWVRIYNEFIKDDKYKKFEVFGGKGYTTERIIKDGKEYVGAIFARRNAEMRAMQPWLISEGFAYLFAPTIGQIFFQIGYDYFKKESKITLFIAAILVPVMISIFNFLKIQIEKSGEDSKDKQSKKKVE